MKLTIEFWEKAKGSKSAEEILALAKETGEELTKEQAEEIYAKFHSTGELTDEELDKVAGGEDFSNPDLICSGYCDHVPACGCERTMYGFWINPQDRAMGIHWYCSVCHKPQ